jgi:hypothetical protein
MREEFSPEVLKDVTDQLLRSALHDLQVARWTPFEHMSPRDLRSVAKEIIKICDHANGLHGRVNEALKAKNPNAPAIVSDELKLRE